MQKFTLKVFTAAAVMFVCSAQLHAQSIINTIAGSGSYGYGGDGGPAITAKFASPSGVCVDSDGNIYIADKYNSRVRMISAGTGMISTFAGNGVFGLSGLEGPADMASIRYPDAVYADPDGTIYLSDWYNDIILSVDRPRHHLHGGCGNGHQGSGGDGGDADEAQLEIPAHACTDAFHNMYVADQGNNRIRKVDYSTNIVYTIGNGSGAHGYSGDGGNAYNATFQRISSVFYDDYDHSLYVADAGANVIRKLDNEFIISTIAGTGTPGYSGDGGSARTAMLFNPGNMFIDHSRNLYVCDRGNNVIRKINLATGIISTIAGNGTMGFSGDGGSPTMAQLNDPEGVWVSNTGQLYIADAGNQRIREITFAAATSGGTGASSTGAGTSATSFFSAIPKDNHNIATAAAGYKDTKIFPNPSAGTFTLQVSDDQLNGTLSIVNVVGEQVFNASITSAEVTIDLSNQATGVYILSLKNPGGTYLQKLVIAR